MGIPLYFARYSHVILNASLLSWPDCSMKPGFVFCFLVFLLSWGCGSTQQREATEQLLTSDAVDRSIAQIDFRALSGKTVFFDTTYLKNIKNVGFVNAEYITSSLRQQLVAARCLLRDDKKDAEYVVEARIGVLGNDRHEVTYGVPANNFLNAASSLVPNSPTLPSMPELALAKRNEALAAAKIGAFAYHRETGEPVWQSGLSTIRSTTKDTWVMGAGPFQRGDIYGGTKFAGTDLGFSILPAAEEAEAAPLVDYHKPAQFASRLKKPKPEEKPAPAVTAEATPEKPQGEAPPANPVPPPAPEPTAAAPIPKSDANAEGSKTDPNPLTSATKLESESGSRLRIHFNQQKPAEAAKPKSGANQLFQLDPVE